MNGIKRVERDGKNSTAHGHESDLVGIVRHGQTAATSDKYAELIRIDGFKRRSDHRDASTKRLFFVHACVASSHDQSHSEDR